MYSVTARGPAASAGYIVDAESEAEAIEIVNDHLPPGWHAVEARHLPRRVDHAFKNSKLVLRKTRH